MVLAVSAFTVAMVAVAPVAGWACTRIGATRFLVLSLVLMVLAQVAAASATGLAGLVAARAVQGVACSGIPGDPPGPPALLARDASALHGGMGLGHRGRSGCRPAGRGLVSDAVGWRGLFLVYALVCAAGLLCLLRFVPAVPAVQQPVEVGGTAQLVAGAGLLVVGMTWAGQGGAPAERRPRRGRSRPARLGPAAAPPSWAPAGSGCCATRRTS
ncbi:MFS transporter [Janibacter melonis]|uniref:MFS transporter n=1 Tax=Janibacter melonis TaxID=262209 RepID=UPI00209472A7|nr:MFS transporter [Janibacter melonis]